MEPELKTFGDWLRVTRKLKGLTQKELARKAEDVCTDAYISALERNADVGKRGQPTRPSEEIVEKLAYALGQPVALAREMAGYAATRRAEIPEEKELVTLFRDLAEETQENLLAIARALHGQEAKRMATRPAAQMKEVWIIESAGDSSNKN